jgi:hypothetical protein
MFKVGNLKDIISVIIPIFVEYPLYTAKFLDFKNFQEAIYLYTNYGMASFDQIKILKETMNRGRLTSESYPLPNELNPWWIVGFCDGESTFGIKL